MFVDRLLKRVNNALESRIESNNKINYSFNNFMAMSAIVEMRLLLLCILTGTEPNYKRIFI